MCLLWICVHYTGICNILFIFRKPFKMSWVISVSTCPPAHSKNKHSWRSTSTPGLVYNDWTFTLLCHYSRPLQKQFILGCSSLAGAVPSWKLHATAVMDHRCGRRQAIHFPGLLRTLQGVYKNYKLESTPRCVQPVMAPLKGKSNNDKHQIKSNQFFLCKDSDFSLT